MFNCFLSVVGVVHSPRETRQLRRWLTGIFDEISPRFSDWEIVLVNNIHDQTDIDNAIAGLPDELRKHIFLLNLSAPVHRNHAILAGLDRANGDWTALLEFEFSEKPALLTALYEKSQTGFDIVYLRGKTGKNSFFHGIFHWILRTLVNCTSTDGRIIRALSAAAPSIRSSGCAKTVAT